MPQFLYLRGGAVLGGGGGRESEGGGVKRLGHGLDNFVAAVRVDREIGMGVIFGLKACLSWAETRRAARRPPCGPEHSRRAEPFDRKSKWCIHKHTSR